MCANYDVELARLRREERKLAATITTMMNDGRMMEARDYCGALDDVQKSMQMFTRRLAYVSQLETRVRAAMSSRREAEVLAEAKNLIQDLSQFLPGDEIKQIAEELSDAQKLMDMVTGTVVGAVRDAATEKITDAQVDAMFDAAQRIHAANSNSVFGLRVQKTSTRDFTEIDKQIAALQAPWRTNENSATTT